MLRLLTIEFHKLRYNKASRVLTIIYFGLLTSIALIAAIKFDIGMFKFHLAELGIFNFPYVWHFNTYMAAILKFFLLLVIVSMMANEYSYKTLKQNLIDGLSKKEFILSKFYTVVVFAAASTIFVFIVSLILGLIYSDFDEMGIIFSDMEYLFAFFIKLIGFFSFGLFFGILIKRSAFAVGAMLVWWIVEGIIWLLLMFSYRDVSNDFERLSKVEVYTQFLPFTAMGNLITEPFTKLRSAKSLAETVGQTINKSYDVQLSSILIVSVWSVLFIYWSYVLLKKRDL